MNVVADRNFIHALAENFHLFTGGCVVGSHTMERLAEIQHNYTGHEPHTLLVSQETIVMLKNAVDHTYNQMVTEGLIQTP